MLLSMLLVGAAARAAEPSPEAAMLMKLFGTGPVTADLFTAGFLGKAPIGEISDVFSKVRSAVGPAISVEKAGSGYVVHTQTFTVPVDLSLADGKVDSLVLKQPVQNLATLPDVLKALDGLSGDVGYLVTKNDAVLYAHAEKQPLAVFSGFKLAVLATLADEIKAGTLKWDQVVPLDAHDISLTPGVLQDFPAGSPVTVHTLAALMTAQSDNTATDQLIDIVGRDKVAKKLGTGFVLKTTEFYKLKGDPARQLRYIDADDAGRQQMTTELASAPLPAPADVMAPLTDKLEWYLSPTDLCRLMAEVAGLDVMSINPGVARRDDWDHVGFKSGSEVGVASLTSALADHDGNRYCVTVTVNDHKALDENRITSVYTALVAQLANPAPAPAATSP
jgi:beta-lactamase class A